MKQSFHSTIFNSSMTLIYQRLIEQLVILLARKSRISNEISHFDLNPCNFKPTQESGYSFLNFQAVYARNRDRETAVFPLKSVLDLVPTALNFSNPQPRNLSVFVSACYKSLHYTHFSLRKHFSLYSNPSEETFSHLKICFYVFHCKSLRIVK